MMRYRNRRRRKSGHAALDIMLTPLIDVALTLLIIFMVTSPMIQHAIKVNLPKSDVKEGGSQVPELVVTIDQKGNLFFNNKPITLDALGTTIKTYAAKSSVSSVWVHIDESKPCGMLIGVIDRIKRIGGIKDVKVATQAMAAPLA
jgi:biopolymer transport protein ExbD